MKCKQKRFKFTLVMIFLLTITVGNKNLAAESNTSSVFDFSNQNESTEFYEDLDGEWLFFEKKLLTPSETQESLKVAGEVVTIPNSFETLTGDINSFGTYSTTIKIPEQYVGETLAIHVPYQYSAYTLFANQREVSKNGEVGKDKVAHQAEMSPKIGYFIAQSEEVLLTMQVSSFDHIRGGFENSIYVGEASVIAKKFNTNMIVTLFINGSIFIIGLFMVLFALYRRKEHVFFLFGLFSMFISARALFTVPFYYTLIFIDMSWLWGTRMEYIFTEATSMFFVVLLWKWHEKEFSKKVMYALVVVHTALIIATLFTQPVFFQTLFFNVFYLAIPTFFYSVYVISKSIRNNNRTAKVNLIGMGLIFLAFFNDFALGQNWYKSVPLMLPAVAIYVLIHVILMSRDFADSVRKTEKQNEQLLVLNTQNEELAINLQQEIKQKDNFLANTSHELRNPLHGIINITQSILRNRTDLDEKIQNDLVLQLSIGHHMTHTIEDLLDITRLKENRIHLRKERLNVHSIAAGVIDMHKVLIENKNIQIDLHVSSDFPRVAADKTRFIQILFNLIHNAVKYTEEGVITVDAHIQAGMAHIHVTDTGVGMSESTLQTIFDAYVQDDSSITALGGGLGLGLSICRQLVELHGGTIKASSSVKEGSVFTFTLPLAENTFTEEVAATIPSTIETKEFSFKETPLAIEKMMGAFTENTELSYRPRILAIDDDPVNLKILTHILSEDQYEVQTVTSGKEALKQLEWKEWDLIITDVMMPKMSGYELTRSIRKSFSISELPILLLTARSNQEDVYTGFLAGANDYVTKPVDAMELNVRVRALTDLHASINERLGMEAAWLQAQIRPHFLLNTLNAIVSLSEIDTSRMVNLINKFTHYLQSSFYLKNLEKVVPLKYELDLLESYLYIEKVRFGDRLRIKWEIDEATEDVMIPPLSIQTLVENAVNHGVLAQIDGGLIIIRIRTEGDGTKISIIDDGVGMDKEKVKELFTAQRDRTKGIGLANTEQRLKRLYGEGLHISSTPNVGTSISFTVY